VLGHKGPYLNDILQAPAQEFQSSRHVLDRLLTLPDHIGSPEHTSRQPPLRIKAYRAMQEDQISRPYGMAIRAIDWIQFVGGDDVFGHV
jgi:hypothetical protein